MLEKIDLEYRTKRNTYDKRIDGLKYELSILEQKLKKAGLPVIIIFEGWGASGKGRMISKLINNLDPRGFKVYSNKLPEDYERRRPFLWRYWTEIPEYGKISVLDRSWYQDVFTERIESGLSDEETMKRAESIKAMERQLTDDGYLIIKFFLHISQKEQKKRFDRLDSDKDTEWRVTEKDRKRNREYDRYYKAFDEMLERTDTRRIPWHVISGEDKLGMRLEVFKTVIDSVNKAIADAEKKKSVSGVKVMIDIPSEYKLIKMPVLSDIMLNNSLQKAEYKSRLKGLQDELSDLHNRLYRKKVPVIICYEGWDAAGKGGNIRRVTAAMDPRGYEVIPIASPSTEELSHHYLWRFWKHLPKTGHIAIFDRTWYGRVMVERIEGLCSEEEWKRAYREINEFERDLTDWGAVVIKFWLQIDKDEQLRRFQDRENTPEKRWKITDEDWRNREKWDKYEEAVNDMLKYTSTETAPWHIIESQDKRYGRISALEIIIDEIKKHV